MHSGLERFFSHFYRLALVFGCLGWFQVGVALDISTRSKEAREMSALIEKYENGGVYEGDSGGGSEAVVGEGTENFGQKFVSEPEDPFEFIEDGNNWDTDIVSQSVDDTEDEVQRDVEETQRAAEKAAWELSDWAR